ncbi:WD40/YVTN/BNR-like repeat-containing protein, partial [Escherichia coli]
LFTDPQNDQTIYVMSAPALRSTDGGKTWSTINTPHGDHHNLWINPLNSNNMIASDDGGASISFNKGRSWSSQQNLPTAQFYRINVDNQFPYR